MIRLSGPLLAGESSPAGEVDASRLGPVTGWLRGLYEDHRFFYALLAVVTLLGAGALLGILTEGFLALIGMETEELDHAE
jgi:hypothetical protein